jgi:hypothetical protein
VVARQICNISRTVLRNPATNCQPGITEWFLDGPAAVPDTSGNLVAQPPTAAPQPSSNGPQPIEVEPGLIRVHAYPVGPEIANAIVSMDTSGRTVPPQYCQVPIEVAGSIPGVQEQLFIAPPQDPEDAYQARRWAQANNVAILPQFACNEQMLSAQAGGPGAPGVTANILSPTAGSVIPNSQQVDIVGNATFSPDVAVHYRVEIKGGPWAEYVTVHEPHPNTVTNGLLESIPPQGLLPAEYAIRVVVVAPNGDGIYYSPAVPFTITG